MKHPNVRQVVSSIEIRVAKELARLRRDQGPRQTLAVLSAVRHDIKRLYVATGIEDAYRAGIRVGRGRKRRRH